MGHDNKPRVTTVEISDIIVLFLDAVFDKFGITIGFSDIIIFCKVGINFE